MSVVIRMAAVQNARKVTERCRALRAALNAAEIPLDAPLVYAALMLAATICQAAKLDRARYMEWSSACWKACEEQQRTRKEDQKKK